MAHIDYKLEEDFSEVIKCLCEKTFDHVKNIKSILEKKEIDKFLDKTLKRLKDIKDPTSRTATESVKEEKEKLNAEEKMRRKLLKEQLRKEIEEEKEEDTEEK
jgi:hypothetical protein